MNLVRPEQMPYDNVARKHYDSGDYPRALRMAREQLDLDKWRERQKKGEPDGRIIGIGFASYCEQSAHGTSVFAAWGLPMTPGYDQAAVRLTAGGGLEVRIGVQSHGQGMETTMAQLAHQVLGIDVRGCRSCTATPAPRRSPPALTPRARIVMSGGAVVNACKELIPRFVRIGAHLMKAAETDCRFEAGAILGPDGKKATLADIAEAWYMRPERLPDNVDRQGLEASRRLQAEARQRRVQLCLACRRRRSRYRHRAGGDPRLRGGRGLRDAGESRGCRGPGDRRHRAGHRHGDVRGAAVRRQRPAERLDARRLPDPRADGGAEHPHLPPGDRRRLTRSSASRAWARAGRSRRRR